MFLLGDVWIFTFKWNRWVLVSSGQIVMLNELDKDFVLKAFRILDNILYTCYKWDGEVESPVIPTLRDNILLCKVFPTLCACVCILMHIYMYMLNITSEIVLCIYFALYSISWNFLAVLWGSGSRLLSVYSLLNISPTLNDQRVPRWISSRSSQVLPLGTCWFWAFGCLGDRPNMEFPGWSAGIRIQMRPL